MEFPFLASIRNQNLLTLAPPATRVNDIQEPQKFLGQGLGFLTAPSRDLLPWYLTACSHSRPPLSTRDMSQDPQWMPNTVDGAEPCIYYVLSYTDIPTYNKV